MPERTDWEARARGILRSEMARRGVTYAQLAEKLAAIGVDENERNLRNKVSRGKFTAGFYAPMPSRIRGAAIALGLIVALPSALAQERIEPALESQPEPEAGQDTRAGQGQQSTSQQEADAEQLIPALNAIETAIRDQITGEDAQQRERQEHREISDLDAQQDMAFWAKAMFWAVFASVVLTFAGLCLIWVDPLPY